MLHRKLTPVKLYLLQVSVLQALDPCAMMDPCLAHMAIPVRVLANQYRKEQRYNHDDGDMHLVDGNLEDNNIESAEECVDEDGEIFSLLTINKHHP